MSPSHHRTQSPEQRLAEDAADANEEPDSQGLFRARLAAGDYDALLGQGLRRTLQSAAADATLEAEIGALRVALAKLLNEEDDPARLAAGVSRVAGVALQAARLRSSASADGEGFRNTLLRELDAYERELAQQAGQDQQTNEEMTNDDADGRNGDVPPEPGGRAGSGVRSGAG